MDIRQMFAYVQQGIEIRFTYECRAVFITVKKLSAIEEAIVLIDSDFDKNIEATIKQLCINVREKTMSTTCS